MDKLEVVKCANGYIVKPSNSDAQYQAELSKDDKAKIAAFAMKDNRVVSLGINGYPSGYDDSDPTHKYDTIKYCHVFNSWEECSVFMLNTLEGNNARR